jgi:lysozyme
MDLRNIHPAAKGAAAATAVWLTIAVALVGPFEGLALKPYVDYIGRGHPETWCYGATKDAGYPAPPFSKVFTKAECDTLLGKDLVRYDAFVHTCVYVPLPPHREAALVSFVYNLGQGALCHGAVSRRLNFGDVVGGCRAMLGYNHSLGRIRDGLTVRRRAEYRECLRSD